MRRIFSIILVLLMLFSMSVTVFAADSSMNNNDKNSEIDVSAKYEQYIDGIYKAELQNGSASVAAADGMTVSVSGVPASAVWLEIFLIPDSETEALAWMRDKISGYGTLVHSYIISLVDTNGNRTNANGVSVAITCKHCGDWNTLVGLDSDGLVALIDTSNGSFTTNGSDYYIIAKKSGVAGMTVPVRGEENEIHADVTIDDKTVELHELDFAEIDHIVGDHVNTGIVEIDLTGLEKDVVQVILPVPTIEHVVEAAEEAHNDTEALQIDFPSGSVKLDDKTMRAVVEQAECNEIILVLESVGKSRLNEKQEAAVENLNVYGCYEAYLFCVKGNKRISDFEGGVATLSVPFEVPDGLKAEKFSV